MKTSTVVALISSLSGLALVLCQLDDCLAAIENVTAAALDCEQYLDTTVTPPAV